MASPIKASTKERRLVYVFVVAGVLAGALLLLGAAPAYASTTVNCPPYGTGDLQAAIDAAAPGATIVVNGTCTGPFLIGFRDVTLQGGLSPHTLNGDGSLSTLSIFNETKGRIAITVKGLTIKNGDGDFPFGGGIGITEPKLDVTLVNSIVTGNHATGTGGGGIEVGSIDQTLSLVNSIVSNNVSSGRGGGILMREHEESVTLVNSAVTGNSGADGGGIDMLEDGSSLSLTNSTVSGNTAEFDGGGIRNEGGDAGVDITLNGSTVNGNTAAHDDGGGIDMHDVGTLTLTHSTVASNVAGGDGGGIAVEHNGVTVDLTGSAITGNTAGNDPNQGGNGGGINVFFFQSVEIALTNSLVAGNQALTSLTDQGGQGGGIRYRVCGVNMLTLDDTTVDGNVSGSDGGGIFSFGDSAGGLCPGPANVAVTNSVIADNQAPNGRGGGIYNAADSAGATATSLDHTIVGLNHSQYGAGIYNDGSSPGAAANVSLHESGVGKNIASINGGGIFNDGGLISTDPTVKILFNIPNNCVGC
jgi:hypothetical protein